jgi:hypothetical protein
MKLTDKKPSATQRVLVFGPPKSGKTELVSHLASNFKLLWFDLEQGYATLLKLPVEQQQNVELICLPDSKSYPIAVETMLKVIKGLAVSICEEHGKVGCMLCKKNPEAAYTEVELSTTPEDTIVVIDSLTQLSNSAIAHITKNKPEDYKLEFDDWGYLKIIVEKFLSEVQAANYNIVAITHEEEVEVENKRKKIVPVCGSSKSSRNTARYFDHVVYCEVKNKKHIAASTTTYMNNILTGSRSDVALETGDTLLDIFNHTKGGTPCPGVKTEAATTSSILSKLKAKNKPNT